MHTDTRKKPKDKIKYRDSRIHPMAQQDGK